jgi:hypothetical protein
MAIDIGRLGSLGLAVEASAGSANTTPDVFLPFTENSLRGHHEPIENIGAKKSRIMDTSSVLGRRWMEGDVKIYADVTNAGYLWYLATGMETVNTGTPNSHTFYPSISGNTPPTATLINTRGTTDVEQYTFSAIDELTFEVSDGLAEMTASFQGQYPTAGAAQTATTTSGTVLAFKDYFVQFGSTLTTAGTGATTPLSEFSFVIANNLEVIHRSGSSDVSTIRNKGVKATGSYKLFFDSVTDRDAYYALNKRAMIVTFSGNANESLRIRIPQFRINEAEIDTGLDDFYALTADFTAEDVVDTAGARFFDVRLQNDKSTAYTT